MSQEHVCDKCAGSQEFDAKVAYRRLARKHEQLAQLMARYMSQAGAERSLRVDNALSMAAEAERIVGGVITTDFPECCLVGRKNPNGTVGWFCSGALIHPRIVLTAGHCFIASNRANTVGSTPATVIAAARLYLRRRSKATCGPHFPRHQPCDSPVRRRWNLHSRGLTPRFYSSGGPRRGRHGFLRYRRRHHYGEIFLL